MSEDRPNDEDYKWAISEGAMTEDDKKILTEEVLGECWHDVVWHDLRGSICAKCDIGLNGIFQHNRTFLTPDDKEAVFMAIVKMGRWLDFRRFAQNLFCMNYVTVCDREVMEADFEIWWFSTVNEQGEPHFCQLVIDWWENKSA